MIPNLICVAGAFFAGFGLMHSMVFNQIGGMLGAGQWAAAPAKGGPGQG